MTISSAGEHKATVEIELSDGTVVRRVVRFSGGNPAFHAEEARQAIGAASEWISGGLVGMYGEAITASAVNRAGAAAAAARWGGAK